jgi:PAS domain S-box-containing protein
LQTDCLAKTNQGYNMNYQEKTKAELINDYEELKQKYDSLKSLHNKNITDRNKTKEAIDKGVDQFRKIIELAPIAMAIVNLDGTIEFINNKAVNVFGYLHEDIPDMDSWWALAYPDESYRNEVVTDWMGRVQKALNDNNEIIGNEFRVTCKDGSIKTMYISGVPVLNKIFVLFDDITQRRKAEQALRESEEKFRILFDESPIPTILSEIPTEKIAFINKRLANILGKPRDEIIGKTANELGLLKNPGDQNKLTELITKMGYIDNYEIEKTLPDGSLGSDLVFMRIITIDEKPYCLTIIQDKSEQKQAEEAQKQFSSLLQSTLESTADGILVVDHLGYVTSFNKKFGEQWRIPQELLDTKNDNKLLSFIVDQLKYPDVFLAKVKELYSNPAQNSYDTIEFKDGRVFERYSQPQLIEDKIAGRVWSFRDVTERRLSELALLKAKEIAEENDRLKTAFLHNISHEIRTPMNAILGFSEILNTTELLPEKRKYFTQLIVQSGNQLQSIISDIIDIATIEAGQVKINEDPINLNGTLKTICEQLKFREHSKNIAIRFKKYLPDAEAGILTDETKLIEILTNLIGNALKFTEQGSIEFGYKVKNDFIEFYVKDTGIGIPTEMHEEIFKRFRQLESSSTRQYGGSGLGLSISKSYVEILGGKIWLKSELGKGSTFYFTIPYSKINFQHLDDSPIKVKIDRN